MNPYQKMPKKRLCGQSVLTTCIFVVKDYQIFRILSLGLIMMKDLRKSKLCSTMFTGHVILLKRS